MIARFALFHGEIPQEKRDQFETAILDDLLPTVRDIPGVENATASFARSRDPGAAEITLFLITTYQNLEAVEAALVSQERGKAQAVTQEIFSAYGACTILHHLTETYD